MKKRMMRLAVLVLATAAMESTAGLYDDWSRGMKISFTGYSRPESLTNFPALVTLGESVQGFRYADFQSGVCDDLRFTDSSQTMELAYEVESWDTGGVSVVWVQVPELILSNTAIWAFWGKASTNAPAYTTNGATWADGYKVVYHMNQTNASGGMPDSLNGTTGVVFNVTNAPGRVAGAFAFNGSNALVNCGDINSIEGLARASMELWIKPKTNSLSIQKTFFRKDVVLGLDGGSSLRKPRGMFGVAGWKMPVGGTTVDDGNWHHLMGVFDGAACRLYVDGFLDSGVVAATASIGSSTNALTVGWSTAAVTIFYDGLLDEMRIAGVSRSSNWVWATWMNQASPSFTAAEIGLPTVQVASASGVVSDGATLGGTLVSTGWSDTVAAVFWGTTDAGADPSAWAFTNILPGFQAPGPFSVIVSNLLTNQVYFYTVQASNRFGYGIAASSATFKTMGPPTCDNAAGAYAIGYTNAILRGTLLEGSAANGMFWWGTDPGNLTNATPAQWVSEGPFEEALQGLQNDATYFYRCFVSNQYGTGWASSVTNFTTPVKGVVWNGAGTATSFLASNPTNWLGGLCPTNGDAVCLDGTTNKAMTWDLTNVTIRAWNQDTGYNGTVTFLTKFAAGGAFRQFQITGNCRILDGSWTHLANGGNAAEHDRLSVKIGGDLLVGPTGSINVDQKGFTQSQGPSAGGTTTGSSGAGHGGQASMGVSLLPIWPTYGSVYFPTNLGSAAYVRGGGAVLLDVGGNAHLDGLITAAGTGGNRAGSAGGSILIKAGSISGTGVVSAAGGYGVSPGGAGGGGRVAVILTAGTTFGDVSFRAYGGTAGISSYNAAGGTVYLQKAGQGEGQGTLIVDAGNQTQPNPLGACTLIPDAGPRNGDHNLNGLEAIVIRNRGILGINTNTTLDFGVVPIFGSGASVVANWRTASAAPAAAAIALRATNRVTFPNPFVISNYSLCLDVPVTVSGNWRVASNGSLSHSGNNGPTPGFEDYRLRLELTGNLTVDPGGAIEANTKGYFGEKGPAPSAQGQSIRGASHGGRGAQGNNDPTRYSLNGYGSVTAPTTLGSGGGRYLSTDWPPRPGAGAIQLTVHGTTTVHGVISARQLLPVAYRAGGAAGGSIFLRTGWLEGTGSIDARGDSGDSNCGAGGGGRVAVILTDSDSFGGVAMSAAGNVNVGNSAAGTLYLQRASEAPGRGQLLVDNLNITVSGTNTTTQLPAPAYATEGELTPVALIITNRGQAALTTNLAMRNLYLYTNCILYLKGYTLTLSSTYHADWGSTNWVVYEGGQIVWKPRRGALILVR